MFEHSLHSYCFGIVEK
uniref:Uncharacterized protein n=1 Tax=Arundo donax TaxID=35708 RepID=A0A0A9AFY6_ARUDO